MSRYLSSIFSCSLLTTTNVFWHYSTILPSSFREKDLVRNPHSAGKIPPLLRLCYLVAVAGLALLCSARSLSSALMCSDVM